MNLTVDADHRRSDRVTTALGMTLCAWCLGYAIDINLGDYAPLALLWLSVGAIICVACVAVGRIEAVEELSSSFLPLALAFGVLIQGAMLLHETWGDSSIREGTALIAALGFLQMFNLRGMRVALIAVMLIAFSIIAPIAFRQHALNPFIDVYQFQQSAAMALSQGINPYHVRIYSPYPVGTPFYGPGVVDENHVLTVGFPYPPLSILLIWPAYLLGGDCRYAHVAAMVIAAALMAAARPGRLGALAAALFLLTPRVFYVIDNSWTEPLLVLTFSMLMFCACRWRAVLPYALGLFFATKQYTVLTVPLLWLLMEPGQSWRWLINVLMKAGIVAAVITLPFFFWGPHDFFRSVVEFQFLQPFRTDALSYLVWVYNNYNGYKMPIWTPFLLVIPAIVLALRRGTRTPAGFAAAVTLVNLAFFAFNKQAFCNYYYFVIATACWTVAATWIRPVAALPANVPAQVGR